MKNLRIAALHWNTPSVGGINTTLQVYRKIADECGDTFHVLASNNQQTKKPEVFTSRVRVRGGDSFIYIDGTAPHHALNVDSTACFLRDNYDVIITSYLCPHPVKAYGDIPVFLSLLNHPALKKLPLIGRISDAYWSTYESWGVQAIAAYDRVIMAQPAYDYGISPKCEPGYLPFVALTKPTRIVRKPKRVCWLPQWKNIKGVYPFFKGIPQLLQAGFDVQLFNNGIEYYKLRLTPEWTNTVCEDMLVGSCCDSLEPGASFHGCRPLEEIERELCLSSFMCDFQGHTAKYAAYKNGSYNHTMIEALYFGAVPVVSSNFLKSGVPPEFVIALKDLADYPEEIARFKLKSYPRVAARQYVLDHFDGRKLYGKIFDRYRTTRR